MVAINSGSQIGRWWSAFQITTANNTVETNSTMSPVASLGEVSGFPLKLSTLLLSHEEGVDVFSDHLLERGSTG